MTKVDIGIDLGIASCGWAIKKADNSHALLEHGVRLFDTTTDKKDDALKNDTRRLKRLMRRRYNRIKIRRRAAIKLFQDYGLIRLANPDFNNREAVAEEFLKTYIRNTEVIKKMVKRYGSMFVYEIRAKGAKGKIEKDELVLALYWYITHRGHSYDSVDDKKEKKEGPDYSSAYKAQYKGKFPAEAQLAFFNSFSGKDGEHSLPSFLKGSFNRGIRRQDYVEELRAILKNNFHLYRSEKFAEDFTYLFEHQRSFEDGPGNEKSYATRFGRFYEFKDGKIIKRAKPLHRLWEGTIGMCPVYADQIRAPSSLVLAQVFNLCQAVNNTRFLNQADLMTEELRKEIITKAATSKKDATKTILKLLQERLNIKAEEIIVPGKISEKQAEYPGLKTYHEMLKAAPELKECPLFGQKGEYLSDNVFDKIGNLLAQYRNEQERANEIKKVADQVKLKLKEESLLNLQKLPFPAKRHAYSSKALLAFVSEMLSKGTNAEQIKGRIFRERTEKLGKSSSETIDKYGKHYLKSDWVNERITSPNVKRSITQAVNVLNAIFNLCKNQNWKVDNIVIEMAREKNNEEIRNKYKSINEANAARNNAVKERMGNVKDPSGTFLLKAWLLEQQRGCDAYTGELICTEGLSGEELWKKLNKYDVDHIIPYSISFDNSRSNLALTKKEENSEKKNKTPFEYLGAAKHAQLEAQWNSWYTNNPSFNDKKKLEKMLDKKDYSDPFNQLGFIQRNLVDTQYATKELQQAIRFFAANNGLDIKVKSINGKMTSFLRSRMNRKIKRNGEWIADPDMSLKRPEGIPDHYAEQGKDRTWHGHHAEDAYIVTLLNAEYKSSKAVEMLEEDIFWARKEKSAKYLDLRMNDEFPEIEGVADIGRNELNNKMSEVHFSRMVLKPKNVELFNETLYAGKNLGNGKIQKVSKVPLTTDSGIKKLSKYFDDQVNETDVRAELPIYTKNPELYSALREVFKRYKDSKNPFAAYVSDPKEAMQPRKYPHVVVSYMQNGVRQTKTVKALTVLGEVVDEERVVQKGTITGKTVNGNSFYQSLNWVELQVYENKIGERIILPVSASYFKFAKKNQKSDEIAWLPITSRIEKFKKDNQIDFSRVPVFKLRKGDVARATRTRGEGLRKISEGDLLYVCGAVPAKNLVEVKPLDRHRDVDKNIRVQVKITDIDPVKTDVLGLKVKNKLRNRE